MIHTRTRSRYYPDSFKVGSPLRHKLGTTPLRQPVKRRRLGVSALSFKVPQSSSDTNSEEGEGSNRGGGTMNGGPRAALMPRRGAARVRLKNLTRSPLNKDSPRKRKRSEGEYDPDDSESWVETEDETGDLIAEDDQHLLQVAPAQSLQRLRKEELVRLWKVAGMWPDEEDDVRMGDDGVNGENQSLNLGKTQLVNGLLQFRRQSSSVASPAMSSRSVERPFTPRPTRSHSASTKPISRASSSDGSQKETGVEATPRAITRVRTGPLNSPSDITSRGKERSKSRAKPGKPRPKGTARHDNLRARFANIMKTQDSPLPRRSRQGSNRSSQYVTTSESDDGVANGSRPRRLGIRAEDSPPSYGGVRATPLIKRLRPRNRGASFTSQASTEVDADAEDNGEDNEDEHESAPSSSRKGSLSTRPERRAKKAAIEALRQGDDDEMSIDDAASELDGGAKQPSAAASTSSRKAPKRTSSSSSTRSQRSAGGRDIDVDQEATEGSAVRTTRSGKAFGNMQQRVDELDTLEDDSMDEDMPDETQDWTLDTSLQEATLSTLTRLRRDQLVQMSEARGLEVGGTKPQLAKALIEWRDERGNRLERVSSASSQTTARAHSPKIVDAVVSHTHREGQVTPVLMREHVHAEDPATPARSEDDATKTCENDLNLDLQELGLEDFNIKPEFLQKLDKIGSGGFKDVFVGKLRGRKVAISEFREHLSEMDIKELKLLAEFRHPNIVRFRGICIPEDSSQVPCMLVSELCENGDLFDYIRNVPPPTLKRVLSLMLDIARGLEYLHLRKPAVIHRDCKSTNILITRHGVAKVGDFGLARVKHSTRSMIRSLVGTVNWQAPELWHPHPRYDYKVDVFSAALVYWEMLSGWSGNKKYPWEGHNEHYIYDAVGQKHKRPSLAGLRKHWGPEPVNLIERMWHQDPAERPTMTDVVADLEALIAEC